MRATPNRPDCECAAGRSPNLMHSKKCPVTRWDKLLNEEVIANVIAQGEVFKYDVDDDFDYIDSEREVWEGELVLDEDDADNPLPPGHPNDWSDEDWLELANILYHMPAKDALKWEQLVFDLIDDAADEDADVIDGECDCMAEKYGGHHSMSCPEYMPKAAITTVYEPDTPKTPPVCNCNSEKFQGVHTSVCPCHPDFGKKKPWVPKCKHDRELDKPFKLTDTQSIGLVAWRDVKYVDDSAIDVGVYLYESWVNGDTLVSPGLVVPWAQDRATKAVIIKWQDYAAYDDFDHLKDIVCWMLDEMSNGKKFETGCLGGHGRTGTFAACILIAADGDVLPADAIERVRKEHCSSAIENDKQLNMIADWYKFVNGQETWKESKQENKRFEKLKGSKQTYTSSKDSKYTSYGDNYGGSSGWSNPPGVVQGKYGGYYSM